MIPSSLLLAVSSLLATAAASGSQKVLAPPSRHQHDHQIGADILAALETYKDPVDAYVALFPDSAAKLAEPRLLHVAGEEKARWLTEGDKMRLRRIPAKFADVTDHYQFYDHLIETNAKPDPHLPDLKHFQLVKPLFKKVSTQRLHDDLKLLSGFYSRYFGSTTGEKSATWLHGQISEIIKTAPFHTHISLEYFTHEFPQPTIIARFEPKVANFSAPLTVIGAHQDSMNYLFPLLPAPGADDDGSGSISILEAFRILAQSGYTPLNGPVEFMWFAAEEGGLLGSQAVARYKKESGVRIGAMLEFDMTAFIAQNATESVGIIESQSNPALTNWTYNLAKQYMSIDAGVYQLPGNAGSDYMSFTKAGFPSTFATEGNPMAQEGGPLMGEFDPYVHTVKDTIDVDDETGHFSFEHMARFSEFALAFVVEQAGWDNQWR